MTRPLERLDRIDVQVDVHEEIRPGSPEVWRPNSFQEWIEFKRVSAVMEAWSEQARHERALRLSASRWIFSLIALQVLGVFFIIASIGFGFMALDVRVLQVLIGAVCADIFGLGFVVVRFLYKEPLKIDIKDILRGSEKPMTSCTLAS